MHMRNFKNLVNSETPIKVCLRNKHFVPQIEKTSNGGYIKMEHNIMPQEVLMEELYRSECSDVGRVRVFGELPTVFNSSVLTFGVQ
jgi:hypothetical protein